MKSKKKLLVAMAAMSVAAIGAGTVSTFAWYRAETYGKAVLGMNTAQATLTADDPGYSTVSVDLPLKVTVIRQELKSGRGTTKNLELAHWYDEDALSSAKKYDGTTMGTHSEGLYHAYYKTSESSSIVYRRATEAASLDAETVDPIAAYKIGVYVEFPAAADAQAPVIGTSSGFVKPSDTVLWQDINGKQWNASEVKTEMASLKLDIVLDQYGGSSRAKFFSLTKSDTVVTTYAEGNANPSPVTTDAIGSGISSATSGSPVIVGSFALYVEGLNNEGGAETVGEASDPNGNFEVTIAAEGTGA